MKKTIAMLMLLAGMAVAHAESDTTYTFTSGVGASGPNYGTTKGVVFTLLPSADAYSVSSSDGLTVEELPESLLLTSVQINKCGQTVTSGVWGILYDGAEDMVIAVAHSGSTSAGNVVTFNFDSVSLKTGKTYNLYFDKAAADSATVEVGNSFADFSSTIDAFILYTSLTDSGYTSHRGDTELGYVTGGNLASGVQASDITGGGSMVPAMTLVLKTPEPATATLSLLALAGLAARRRRH